MRRVGTLALLLVGASAASAASAAGAGDAAALLARGLAVPVAGVARAALRDTYLDGRPGHPHEAIDIAAARGTPVLAVADGRIAKLFTSVPGGLTVYQLDAQQRFIHYYAHLDRYADGLREGALVRRCDPIGFVGSSGNAAPDAPHLHFAVFVANAERQWWTGEPLNPYPALAAAGVPGC